MLQSTEYYMVVDNRLVNIREMASGEDADNIIEELEAMVERKPANTEPCSVLTSHLTPKTAGPLAADLVRNVSAAQGGIDLMQSTDPEDGVTSYLLPYRGSLQTVEDIIGGMSLEEFRFLADALDDYFYDRMGQETPAQVFHIGLDRNTQVSEPFASFLSPILERARRGQVTVLQWTE